MSLQSPTRLTVAVLGATGVVGRALVPALTETADVVAVSRRGGGPADERVRLAAADVTDPGAVGRALEGVDVVHYLVHSLETPDFSERDRTGAEVVAREAERAGVRRIVYLGGLGDDRPDLSEHLRSRIETAHALASGSVPVTTLRAAVVVGRGSAGFETIVSLVDRLPAMIAPRWLSTPTQPIALADVVRYLVAATDHPAMAGQAFDIGGPDVLTSRDMVETVARIRGRRPLIIEVPVLTPWLSSLWLHLVTPTRAGVARHLIEGLRTPTVVRDDRIRALVPGEPISFEDAARDALGAT